MVSVAAVVDEMRIKNKKLRLNSALNGVFLAIVASSTGLAIAAQDESRKSPTKSWRVEELLPPTGLDASRTESTSARTGRHTTSVMGRVTKAQSAQNQALKGFYDRQGVISQQDQKFRLAALKDLKLANFGEGRELSRYMLNQLGKALADEAQEQSEFLSTLGRGLSFKVDSNGLAAGKDGGPSGGRVRYGLVLKEVKASGRGVHVAALTMDDSYLEQALASKSRAKVDWTIGPLSEERQGNLFSALDNLALTNPPAPARAQGIFAMRPDFSLRGKVLPNFNSSSPGKAGLRLRFEQPQGLYRMEMLTGGGTKANQIEHEFRLPLYGKLMVVRQLNSTMTATKTSVLNVLGFYDRLEGYPLNVHYTHADSILKAETGFNMVRGRVGIEANVPNPAARQAAQRSSAAINYARGF